MTKKVLHQSIQGNREWYTLIVHYFIIKSFKAQYYLRKRALLKQTTQYISCWFKISLNIKCKKMCQFGLCYCVKCSSNISLNQNTTWVYDPTRTTATNQTYCLWTDLNFAEPYRNFDFLFLLYKRSKTSIVIQINVKTVNYWYLVFVVTPRHDPDVFQSCCVNEDRSSNLLKRLSNISIMKYCA